MSFLGNSSISCSYSFFRFSLSRGRVTPLLALFKKGAKLLSSGRTIKTTPRQRVLALCGGVKNPLEQFDKRINAVYQ